MWTAAFLEAAGSLSVLGAQVVYFSQPLISWMVSEEQMTSLARLLEDSSNRQIFVGYLREVDVL